MKHGFVLFMIYALGVFAGAAMASYFILPGPIGIWMIVGALLNRALVYCYVD